MGLPSASSVLTMMDIDACGGDAHSLSSPCPEVTGTAWPTDQLSIPVVISVQITWGKK